MHSKPQKRPAEPVICRRSWKFCSTAKTKAQAKMLPRFLQPSYALLLRLIRARAHKSSLLSAACSMSALGQKRTWRQVRAMSAVTPKADIRGDIIDVRFVPKADVALYSISSSARAGRIQVATDGRLEGAGRLAQTARRKVSFATLSGFAANPAQAFPLGQAAWAVVECVEPVSLN
jgi:hypothetical protein